MTHPTLDQLREAVDYIDALISAQGEILLEGQSDPCDIVMRARAALAAAPQPAPAPAADEALADYPVIPDTPEERAYRAGWNADMGEMLKGATLIDGLSDEELAADVEGDIRVGTLAPLSTPAADERAAMVGVIRQAMEALGHALLLAAKDYRK